jgi:hypothetical protein
MRMRMRVAMTMTIDISLSKECEEFGEKKESEVQNRGFNFEQKIISSCLPTSRKNATVKIHAKAEKLAETAQGRKYGYFLRNSEFPNVSGKRSAGRDNDPPIVGLSNINGRSVLIADRLKECHTYPSAPPKDHAIGT